jgi:hypothetical protein
VRYRIQFLYIASCKKETDFSIVYKHCTIAHKVRYRIQFLYIASFKKETDFSVVQMCIVVHALLYTIL